MVEIKFNEAMHRWEVFTDESVIRAGALQPVFVAGDLLTVCEYVRRCGF